MPWSLWLAAWFSTSTAGGCFALLFFVMQGAVRGFGGIFGMGFYLAGFVGVIAFAICGLATAITQARGRSALRLMRIAGGLTGLLAGLIVGPVCLVTCALGAWSAGLPGRWRLHVAL